MSELVSYKSGGRIARVTMDDGKVNVMSVAMLKALHEAFDRAEREQAIVVLSGRPGQFSAGFDLNVFARGNVRESLEMVRLGAELALRLMSFPTPIVAACTGHALPMGAFLMLASDVRIGADGPFRIGLNEVAIKLAVPSFAVELARSRLTPSYLARLNVGALIGPAEAVVAGYLDRVVAPEALHETVDAAASALLAIDMPSHATTKQRVRGPAIAAMQAAIEDEITLEAYDKRAAQRS